MLLCAPIRMIVKAPPRPLHRVAEWTGRSHGTDVARALHSANGSGKASVDRLCEECDTIVQP
jgi:hypothetical protein